MLSKVLPVIFSPVLVIALLVLLGVLLRRRWICMAGALLLVTLSLPLVADALFDRAQGRVVRLNPATVPRADAVVVLGGATSFVRGEFGASPEWGDAIDRMLGGVELMRCERAPKVIVSGGLWSSDPAMPSEGDLSRELMIRLGVASDRIVVSPQSGNTEGEAVKTRRLLPEGSPHIILVTSAFHLERAAFIFERHGFRVTGFPVDLRTPVRSRLLESLIPTPAALTKTEIVIRELLGRSYYRVKYWLESPDVSPATV